MDTTSAPETTDAGALGAYVHRWIPGDDRVALLLHGTGGNEDGLLPLAAMLVPGASVLSLRGNVLEGPMPRFFRRLAEGVFDEQDLALRTSQLAGFIGAAATAYRFDAARLTAIGFSNGANIAANVMLHHPGLIRQAVLFRAMLPSEAAPRQDGTGTRVYLGAGRRDPIVPAPSIERLAALLRQSGAEVTLDWRNAGHNLTSEDVERAKDWLAGG
jgi:phospholipase/carboxylesterase